jgi:cold shock CspA family protein
MSESFTDLQRTCRTCGQGFVWTAAAQSRQAERAREQPERRFVPPTHCWRCRRPWSRTGESADTNTSKTSGVIVRVRDAGFGFIRADGGAELFFHASSVYRGRFDELRIGDTVIFDVVEGVGKSPRAVNVIATYAAPTLSAERREPQRARPPAEEGPYDDH